MNLPRFRIRTILIALTITAIWLSTLSGYRFWNEVQAFIRTAIIVTSGVAALNLTGRPRVFWTGFFGAMLFLSLKTELVQFSPRFAWSVQTARDLTENWLGGADRRGQTVMSVHATLIYATLLVFAILIGFLSVYVYDQIRKENSASE